ncbi:MAG: RidA family protein [Pseudomonadota bacterium]
MEIVRARGTALGRNAGTRFGQLGWAVAAETGGATDIAGQTRATLAELDRVLAELGTDKTKMLNATVYIASIDRKAEMDAVWNAWIGDDPQHWPQRACVESAVGGGCLVEIVVVAVCP